MDDVEAFTNPANDEPILSRVLFDLDFSYALTNNPKLTVGSNNLFNIYPPVLKLAARGQTVNSALAQTIGLPAIGATNTAYCNYYSPFGVSGGFILCARQFLVLGNKGGRPDGSIVG